MALMLFNASLRGMVAIDILGGRVDQGEGEKEMVMTGRCKSFAVEVW